MCNYQSGTYECRGDGYLWDADRDGYDPESFDDPCPECNTAAFLDEAHETAECVSFSSSNTHSATGASLWRNAVAIARAHNPAEAEAALVRIGVVRALVDDRDHPEGCRTELFVYVRSSANPPGAAIPPGTPEALSGSVS